MTKLFGTDGVRGLANTDITADFALKLGESVARVLALKSTSSRKRVLVGRDTRISGEFITSAICAGIASAGVDVIDVGVLPTAGIAFLTSKLGVDFGVVISASHNPMQDNGIKFFSGKGEKLDPDIEDEIENIFGTNWDKPTGNKVGKIHHDFESAQSYYLEYLNDCVLKSLKISKNKTNAPKFSESLPLEGVKVVLDCANGSSYRIGPDAFEQVGAEVISINASPNGVNINKECGSTFPKQLQATVVSTGADLGIAFDGDSDRCIAVDEKGNLLDGDKIITVLAQDLKNDGKLKDDTVVLTTMSNLGTLQALDEQKISYSITDVGDKYVLEEMLKSNLILGGEQSGHIINLDYATTGDGILSGLLLCVVLIKQRKALNSKICLSEMASHIKTLPQILLNVADVDKYKVMNSPKIKEEVKKVENELGKNGRVLLRPSGTESLVRVMVEAVTHDLATKKAQYLVDQVKLIGQSDSENSDI